jgi:hypothetical protein
MVSRRAGPCNALFRVTPAVLAVASCEMVRYSLKWLYRSFVRTIRMDWPGLYMKVLPNGTLSRLGTILVQTCSISDSKVYCTNCNIALGRRAEYKTCIMAGTACLVSRKKP